MGPKFRLVGRAAVAGGAAFFVAAQEACGGSSDFWQPIVVAGVLAAAEVLSPLNPLVGLFKRQA